MATSQDAESPLIHGSCLCRAIRFTLSGGPPRVMVLCHCTNCRKNSGSSFMANAWFRKSLLSFMDDTDQPLDFDHAPAAMKVYEDKTTSTGAPLLRWFCSECGSSLFLSNKVQKDFLVVATGCIDEGSRDVLKYRPVRELFCKGKEAWIPDIEGIQDQRKEQTSAKKQARL